MALRSSKPKPKSARPGRPIIVEIGELSDSTSLEMCETLERAGGVVLAIVYAKPEHPEQLYERRWKLATVTHGEVNASIARSCSEMFSAIADKLAAK